MPFIARWPGRIPAGRTADQTICLTDLLATAAAITESKILNNAGEDSFNILPAPRYEPVREYTLHQTISLALAIRHGDWKYLDHQLRRQQLPSELANGYEAVCPARESAWRVGQLYNPKTDPRTPICTSKKRAPRCWHGVGNSQTPCRSAPRN